MQKGDFVKIDYVGKVSASGEIFDLTDEETAKKLGAYNKDQKYGPVLVIMGAKMVVPGVEKQLEQMKPGDEKEFDLKPAEAFGNRDVKLIKIISMANFIKQNINPVPGIFVTINGMEAKIQSVSGGRVRVDFNHPVAGRDVSYKLKINGQITEPLEKARALVEYYGIKADTKLDAGKLEIKTPKPMPDIVRKLVEGKIKEWIKEIKEVSFDAEEKEKAQETKINGEEGKPKPKAPEENAR